jgi:hypothetical protein
MTLRLKKDKIPNDMIGAWRDTRLLIVNDECSFAPSEVFKQICEKRTNSKNG